MELVNKAYHWKEAHRDSVLFTVLRVALGIFIFIKGVQFAQNTEALQNLITTSRIEFGSVMLAHYVAMIHLTGGFLIAIGALTRLAILFQLPILLGAIILVNAPRAVFAMHFDLIISIIVFLALLFFLFFGSATYSVDRYIRKYDYN